MFWNSILAGLKVLTYWETYVVGLEYLAIIIVPTILWNITTEKFKNTGQMGMGCLGIFLMPLVQMAATSILVLTLAPIIFGEAESAAWNLPWRLITEAPITFFKLVGALTVATILLAFMPFLGRLQSLHTLMLGSMVLIFILSLLDSLNPGSILGKIHFFPGFLFLTGLIIISAILSWIGAMLSLLLTSMIEKIISGLGELTMLSITTVLGFIPVFIYGAWLGAQIRGGF